MRAADTLLMIVPLLIIWLLMPVIQISTLHNAVKGGTIGLYISISIIGLIRTWRALQAQ